MQMILIIGLIVFSLFSGQAFAQPIHAPGEPVTIPGTEIAGWGQVAEVSGHFGLPAVVTDKVPAVLILHGDGIDSRGAFYAKALQEAGIATLEITMFLPGSRPKEGIKATMPHAAAALKWLAAQPKVNGQRLGVMGWSWGSGMSMMMSSELIQERMGKDVPKPAAFAPFYPLCTNWVRNVVNPKHYFYNVQTRMSSAPMLIHIGTLDVYEENERSCEAFVATWPAEAREHVTVRHVQGATHGFDGPEARQYDDPFAHAGRGGTVNTIPNPEAAAEARQAVVSFFVKYLKP